MLKIVTVKMPEELVEALDKYAMQHKLHRSEVIRMALRRLLEDEAPGLIEKVERERLAWAW